MKIVTLCGCGLGTCFILKFSAEKAVRELGIQATIVPSDITSCSTETADLYLAPFGLEVETMDRSTPIIMVKNVLSVAEVKEAIQNALQGLPRS